MRHLSARFRLSVAESPVIFNNLSIVILGTAPIEADGFVHCHNRSAGGDFRDRSIVYYNCQPVVYTAVVSTGIILSIKHDSVSAWFFISVLNLYTRFNISIAEIPFEFRKISIRIIAVISVELQSLHR